MRMTHRPGVLFRALGSGLTPTPLPDALGNLRDGREGSSDQDQQVYLRRIDRGQNADGQERDHAQGLQHDSEGTPASGYAC